MDRFKSCLQGSGAHPVLEYHPRERLCEKSGEYPKLEKVSKNLHPARGGMFIDGDIVGDPHPVRGAMLYFQIGLIRSDGELLSAIGHCTPDGVRLP